MTATTSKLYDKCKHTSAVYAGVRVSDGRAPLEMLPILTRAHLDGTMEGFDLAISLMIRFRAEIKEAEKGDPRQLRFPIEERVGS